ncbi:MAG: DASS family sodium-coupled anion symporter [Chitinophagaceae bacterium]|nr:DASS family sodium-coupled anion symporter [Chitinophagaceae bacterium]MCB9046169.1 DASS family sodium-coupled anion symporter [Chitinophagales bacterium]
MNKSKARIAALLAGILIFLFILLSDTFMLDNKATKVMAVAALMITWWVTQVLPMPVVALLPLLLFPLLGIAGIDEVATSYANPIIFLFMGGFMIALAIEKWGLHKRGALSIIRVTGTSGNRIILGFILASGLMSMWLSNTATTMMMYPIALSVIKVMEDSNTGKGNVTNLGICLMLAIAYSSNFGGIATIIGTPPNVAYVAYLQEEAGYTFQFADWMKLCLPISLILLLTLYFLMVKVLYPNHIPSNHHTKELIGGELKKLGKLSATEKRVLGIFLITAFLWITKSLINEYQTLFKLNDSMIALLGGILMFAFPSGAAENKPILEWHDTKNMAWGILILFGGGIALAGQLEKAGIIESLGDWIAGYATGGILLVFIVTIVSIFISEVMSNVAQVIVFAPVIGGMAQALHIDPLQLGIAMTLGASCAGMLPMGTPPNAIVFASGRLKLHHMTTTGFVMNIVSAVLITLFCWFLLPHLVARII